VQDKHLLIFPLRHQLELMGLRTLTQLVEIPSQSPVPESDDVRRVCIWNNPVSRIIFTTCWRPLLVAACCPGIFRHVYTPVGRKPPTCARCTYRLVAIASRLAFAARLACQRDFPTASFLIGNVLLHCFHFLVKNAINIKGLVGWTKIGEQELEEEIQYLSVTLPPIGQTIATSCRNHSGVRSEFGPLPYPVCGTAEGQLLSNSNQDLLVFAILTLKACDS
jgi:hypothetical protein